MAGDLDTFEKLFCGVWKHDRDENFEEGMKKMSYPEEELKMHLSMKPTITMERKGDAIYFKFEFAPGMAHDCTFKLGEEFEAKDDVSNPPTFHTKEVATLKDGVCTFIAKTQIQGPGKIDTRSDFIIKDGELHSITSPLSDLSIKANRIYKRAN